MKDCFGEQKLSNTKNWIYNHGWYLVSRVADVCGILAIFGITFGGIRLSNQINNIEKKIDQDDARAAIMNYFSYIENGNLSGAYSLISASFKANNPYNGFYNWLTGTIAFEGLKISPLTGKDSAIGKTYLVEFGHKKRGMIPIKSKRGMYVKYNGGKREINANSVLFEKQRKPTACEFYQFEHCK